MGDALRILFVEDSEDDLLLLLRHLRQGGYAPIYERVDTAEAMADALGQGTWDLILSDYSMPQFSAPAALSLLQRTGRDIPFIVVSGTIGEEAAVAALKAGAHDFVAKLQPARLIPAIERELREVEVRREHRASQQALRESEEYFRALIENGAELITVIGADGRATYLSPSYDRILGYAPSELLGADVLGLAHPDDLQRVAEVFDRMLHDELESVELETRLIGRDGAVRTVRAICRNMLDVPTVRGIVVNAYDVTERNELQAQFLQAQKMEAVGRLAGGIAHDFNNLLTGIQGYTDFVLEDTPADDPRREDLEEIRKGVERAAALTRRLLAFSRRQAVEPRVLALGEVLAGVQRMLQRLIGGDIELRVHAAPDLGSVRADPGQIEQVLLNLLVNARDAMADGGTVTIELANEPAAVGDRPADAASRPDGCVRLTVADTGAGMEPEVAGRIFEPFFTTKPEGKGTGLGLSTVHGIVTQHGGRIRVESQPGRGTRFDILLPRVDPLPEASASDAGADASVAGSGTVLLVEDEASIRVLATRALRRAGYTVLAAADGAAAFEILERHPGRIDLVITDMVMPRASGMKVVAATRAARPDARVLIVSGYTEEEATMSSLREAGVAVLEKPFSPEALLRKAQETLVRLPPAAP